MYSILHLSDLHLNVSLMYTDYGVDSSLVLWNATLFSLQQHHTFPDIILYTGDFTAHMNYTWNALYDTIEMVVSDVITLFPNSLHLLSILGNTDSIHGNIFIKISLLNHHIYIKYNRLLHE